MSIFQVYKERDYHFRPLTKELLKVYPSVRRKMRPAAVCAMQEAKVRKEISKTL